jgi:hypothetical protein
MKGWNRIFLVFKAFMAFVYLLLGVVLLFFNMLLFPINDSARIALGIILVLYGIFRIYSTVFKAKGDEEN